MSRHKSFQRQTTMGRSNGETCKVFWKVKLHDKYQESLKNHSCVPF